MKTIIIIYLIGAFIFFIYAYYNAYKSACEHNRKVKNPFLKKKVNLRKVVIYSLIYPIAIVLTIIEVTADINSRKDE